MKNKKLLLVGACLTLGSSLSAEAQEEAAQAVQGNAVIETIMARRSVRQYTDQPVERWKLELIAQCGINAPNGMNWQPWQVRVVTSKEFIDGTTAAFNAANPQMAGDGAKNMFRNATAVIFIASPQDGSGQIDCGLMGENMVLAAQSLGLGTCCLGGCIPFLRNDPSAAPYLERLALPDGYQLLYAIAVGYPAETPEAKPRDAGKVQFVE
ncbi:MAG: nitroreductase family protein [Prevotellaceae bacterium]|nr:nitroreductase family protein [Prevotellaceae bacterium]